jgi:hypothetical protein
MFQKKSLALGLAAALGASTALAAFDLDNTKQTSNTFALETLDSTDATTITAVAYPNVTNGGSAMDVTATIGVGVSNGQDLFVRYDLTNGVFGAAPTFTTATSTNSIAQGGTTGASFVIFQVSATADKTQADATTMAAAKYAPLDSGSPISVSMVVYETLTAATSQGAALVSKTSASGANLAAFGSGLKWTGGAATSANIADVETGFTKFTTNVAADSNLTATIGAAVLDADGTSLDAGDGLAAVLADMVNAGTSTVLYSGDFSVAAHTVGIDDAAACTSPTPLTANTAKDGSDGTTTLTSANTNNNLCYTGDGKSGIPKGDYTVTYTLKSVSATATNPTTTLSGVLGTIAHNGTTVELPYLTTFEDYNQRVVMVNRGSSDAAYTFSAFQTEDGTTATAGTAATGTIPAGGTMIVKVTDIVTLTGNTRTAGTVNIVAPTGNISVATTQVNKSDGGTDTISLH